MHCVVNDGSKYDIVTNRPYDLVMDGSLFLKIIKFIKKLCTDSKIFKKRSRKYRVPIDEENVRIFTIVWSVRVSLINCLKAENQSAD